MCWLLWVESTHHQVSVPFAPNLRVVGPTKSWTKVYTKIDLCGTYNLVCIWEGDEWKMTFITQYNHFEYVVMPFGFTNMHVIFQHLMNNVFREYLDDFLVYYIDDILIFSKNMEDHECHVHLVLEKLQEVGLYNKLEKCEFH